MSSEAESNVQTESEGLGIYSKIPKLPSDQEAATTSEEKEDQPSQEQKSAKASERQAEEKQPSPKASQFTQEGDNPVETQPKEAELSIPAIPLHEVESAHRKRDPSLVRDDYHSPHDEQHLEISDHLSSHTHDEDKASHSEREPPSPKIDDDTKLNIVSQIPKLTFKSDESLNQEPDTQSPNQNNQSTKDVGPIIPALPLHEVESAHRKRDPSLVRDDYHSPHDEHQIEVSDHLDFHSHSEKEQNPQQNENQDGQPLEVLTHLPKLPSTREDQLDKPVDVSKGEYSERALEISERRSERNANPVFATSSIPMKMMSPTKPTGSPTKKRPLIVENKHFRPSQGAIEEEEVSKSLRAVSKGEMPKNDDPVFISRLISELDRERKEHLNVKEYLKAKKVGEQMKQLKLFSRQKDREVLFTEKENKIKNQVDSISQRLDHTKSEFKESSAQLESSFKDQLEYCDKRQNVEKENFETSWDTEEVQRPFTKRSSNLLKVHKVEEYAVYAGELEQAELIKKEIEKISEAEAAKNQRKMEFSYLLKKRQLENKQKGIKRQIVSRQETTRVFNTQKEEKKEESLELAKKKYDPFLKSATRSASFYSAKFKKNPTIILPMNTLFPGADNLPNARKSGAFRAKTGKISDSFIKPAPLALQPLDRKKLNNSKRINIP